METFKSAFLFSFLIFLDHGKRRPLSLEYKSNDTKKVCNNSKYISCKVANMGWWRHTQWTVMWYQLHDVQTNASLARPYDLLEFSRKLTNNNSKQIEMNGTELKSYKKIITAKNLLIKAIKLLHLRKNPCLSNYSTVIAMEVAILAVFTYINEESSRRSTDAFLSALVWTELKVSSQNYLVCKSSFFIASLKYCLELRGEKQFFF